MGVDTKGTLSIKDIDVDDIKKKLIERCGMIIHTK